MASASLGIVLIAKRFRSNGILANELVTLLHPHQDAVQRPAEVPGLRNSAQLIIAEVGPTAYPSCCTYHRMWVTSGCSRLVGPKVFVCGWRGLGGYVTGYDAWNALMRRWEYFSLPILRLLCVELRGLLLARDQECS